LGNQQVLELDVSVNEASLVRVVHSVKQLAEERKSFLLEWKNSETRTQRKTKVEKKKKIEDEPQ